MREHIPDQNPQRHPFWPISGGRVKYIVIGFLVLFVIGQLVEWSSGRQIAALTGIDQSAIAMDFELWRFFSYMWFHNNLLLLLVNTGTLLLLGSHLEQVWSLRKLSGYFVFCALVAGLFSFLIASPQRGLIGATGGIIGLCLLCWRDIPLVRLYGRVRMRQGIWLMGALVITVHYFVPDNGGDPNAGVAQLFGLLGGGTWIFLTPYVKTYYRKWKRYRRGKKRRERARLRRRMEELLDKISEEGIDALTEEERTTLHRASERLDEDLPDES